MRALRCTLYAVVEKRIRGFLMRIEGSRASQVEKNAAARSDVEPRTVRLSIVQIGLECGGAMCDFDARMIRVCCSFAIPLPQRVGWIPLLLTSCSSHYALFGRAKTPTVRRLHVDVALLKEGDV